jgi:hypothetical protein
MAYGDYDNSGMGSPDPVGEGWYPQEWDVPEQGTEGAARARGRGHAGRVAERAGVDVGTPILYGGTQSPHSFIGEGSFTEQPLNETDDAWLSRSQQILNQARNLWNPGTGGTGFGMGADALYNLMQQRFGGGKEPLMGEEYMDYDDNELDVGEYQ